MLISLQDFETKTLNLLLKLPCYINNNRYKKKIIRGNQALCAFILPKK